MTWFKNARKRILKPIIMEEQQKIKRVVTDRRRRDGHSTQQQRSSRELPSKAKAILEAWLFAPDHIMYPYPTPPQQLMLIQKTGGIINKKQLIDWFSNARRRIWKPMLQKYLEEGKLPRVATTVPTRGKLTTVLPSPAGPSIISTTTSTNTCDIEIEIETETKKSAQQSPSQPSPLLIQEESNKQQVRT